MTSVATSYCVNGSLIGMAQEQLKRKGAVTGPQVFALSRGSTEAYERCSMGTYSKSISPVYSSSGRMRMLSLYCSTH